MARGSWDDFTSKWGFGDGACSEDRDFRARDKIVSKLNADPGFQREKVTAVAWDSTGSHNACFVLLFPNPDGLSAEELVAAWEGDRIKETDEMPDLEGEYEYGDGIGGLIGEAYDKIEPEASGVSLNPRELASVLVGLRLRQDELNGYEVIQEDGHEGIASKRGEFVPLSIDEIEALIDRLNCHDGATLLLDVIRVARDELVEVHDTHVYDEGDEHPDDCTICAVVKACNVALGEDGSDDRGGSPEGDRKGCE